MDKNEAKAILGFEPPNKNLAKEKFKQGLSTQMRKSKNLKKAFENVSLDILQIQRELQPLSPDEREAFLNAGLEHLGNLGSFGLYCFDLIKAGLEYGENYFKDGLTPFEYAAVMQGLKRGFDMLGITPRTSPMVAIQNNLNNGNFKNGEVKPININISFVGGKGEAEAKKELIEADIIDDNEA